MEVIVDVDRARWSAGLAKLPVPCRDVYFSPEYHHLHTANGDGSAFCTVIREMDGILLVPGMRVPIPGHAVSDLQSCNGYGGPVAATDASSEFLEHAWDEWRRQCRDRGIIAAFFRLHPLLGNERFLPSDARIIHDRQTVFLEFTGGLEVLWAKAKSQYRNMVNKARRQRIVVRWNDRTAWEQIEALYGHAMERLEAPAFLRFSHAYFEGLRNMPAAELASINDGPDLVAVSVFLFGPRWCHYHLSARSPDAGNHLHSAILQAAIERAVVRGLGGLHLGGGRTTALDDGLLRFKLSSGGETIDFKLALVVADREKYETLCCAWQREESRKPTWLLGYRQPRDLALEVK